MSISFIIALTDLLVTLPFAAGESFAKIANIRLVEPSLNIPQFDRSSIGLCCVNQARPALDLWVW
jgi:hypothetical protein